MAPSSARRRQVHVPHPRRDALVAGVLLNLAGQSTLGSEHRTERVPQSMDAAAHLLLFVWRGGDRTDDAQPLIRRKSDAWR
jgi:hypothetical protein